MTLQDVRAAVAAEYDRLAPVYGRGDRRRNLPRLIGSHLAAVVEELMPDGHEHLTSAYRSVEHLLNGHDGIACPCMDGYPDSTCSGRPESWVLEAFEYLTLTFPLEEDTR